MDRGPGVGRSQKEYLGDMQKILCIEDGAGTILLLEETFKGYLIRFANTVAQATKLFRSDTYDLILLDIELPDGNGLEWMADLRAVIGDTPVIVMSSRTDFTSKMSA